MNPSVMFLHCVECRNVALANGEHPRDHARIEVGVTSKGGLILWCVTHDRPIFMFENDEVGPMLLNVVNTPCEGCREKHADGDEVIH